MSATQTTTPSSSDEFWTAFNSLVERFESVRRFHLDAFNGTGFDSHTKYLAQLASSATAMPSVQDLVTAMRLAFRSSLPVERVPEAERAIASIASAFGLLAEPCVPEPHSIGFLHDGSAQPRLAYSTLPSHHANRREFDALAHETRRQLEALRQWGALLRTAPAVPGGPPVQYVTLDQVAAIVNRSKRTLEKLIGRKKNPFPDSDVPGGGGKANEWNWAKLRAWLEAEYRKQLPPTFPSRSMVFTADRS